MTVEERRQARLAKLKANLVIGHDQDDAIKLTGAGSNARLKMIGRAEFGRDWFSKG